MIIMQSRQSKKKSQQTNYLLCDEEGTSPVLKPKPNFLSGSQ